MNAELPSIPNDRRHAGAKRDKPTKAQDALIITLIENGVHREAAEYRVLDLGFTEEDLTWNRRLGRPVQFLETLDREAEKQRRQDWTDTHPHG